MQPQMANHNSESDTLQSQINKLTEEQMQYYSHLRATTVM
jgi:hypothetical protein